MGAQKALRDRLEKTLEVLLLAGSNDDSRLITDALESASLSAAIHRVSTKRAYRSALAEDRWDAVVADADMPRFQARNAVLMFRDANLMCPLVMISATFDTARAVDLMTDGAHDFVERSELKRLAPILARELRDTGIRKEIQAANEILSETAERFREILDHIPMAFCIKDWHGRFLLVNREFERRHVLKKDEVLGKTSYDIRRKDFADTVTELDRAVLKSGRTMTYERDVTEPDGLRHTYLVHRFPLFASDGAVKSLGLISTDITEQKQVEESMRESEERFRKIFEESGDAMLIGDMRTKQFEDVNAAALALYGYSKDEFCRLTPYDISAEPESTKASIKKISRSGTLRIDVRQSKKKDGTIFPISISAWLVRMGREDKIVFAIRDISDRIKAEKELRESEARLQAFLEASPESVMMKDLEGRYVLVNRAFRERAGLPIDEIIGKKTTDIWSKGFVEIADWSDQEVSQTGETLVYEFEAEGNDGRDHVYSGSKFPVVDAAGKVLGLGTVTSDITERREMERKLSQAQKMEAVGHLTGGVAHDFNNLLGIVMGNTDMLGQLASDDELARACVDRIVRAVDRGTSLTNRLLAFSRQQALISKPTDIAKLVDSLDDMLRRTLGETVEFQTKHKRDLWPALIDPHQLEHAIINLALNARDAMPNGGALTIRTANAILDEAYAEENEEVMPGDYVEVTVTDSGCGMPAGVVANAFEPFFTTKEVGKGSGLGLSMVYGFAKQSMGHIEIDSVVDKGTTVRLFLPRHVEDASVLA